MIGQCSAREKPGTPPSNPLVIRKSGTFGKYKRPIPLGKPEGLHLSSFKRRVEFDESELKTNAEKKRKVRFLEDATMESGKVEAGLETIGLKRKRMTGQSFKAQFKTVHTKEIVTEKSPVSQLEKIPSYEEVEEQVQSVNPKKQCLKQKVASSRDSCNTIGSGREKLFTEACVNKQTSKVDEQRLRPSSLKLKIVRMNIGKVSAKGNHNENQFLSKQQQAVKDKVAGNQIEKNSARTQHYEIFSQKKQAVKDKGAGNQIEKDSARDAHYENHILSQKKQAVKDKVAGQQIQQDSARDEHYETQILSQGKQAVKDKGAGNQIEKNSAREAHYETLILSQRKQAVKDKVAGNQIGKDSAMNPHFENQILSQTKQAVRDKVAGNQIEKDSARDARYENQILSQKQAVKDKGAGREIEKNSSKKEYHENQILLQKKQAVKDKSAGSEIEKNSAKEEHLENHTVLQKKRALKDKGTGNEIEKDSSRGENYGNQILSEKRRAVKDKCDGNEIEKDSAMQEHYENQILPEKKQAMKNYYSGDAIEMNSADKEEHYKNQIVSKQKVAVKNKGARSEIDRLINKIQKKCDKRLEKLTMKQQEKIQEFHQIWGKERSQLEKDHKLDTAIIRFIYREDTATMVNKLKLFDVKLAKEMEEHEILKGKKLEALKAEQLAARSEETQKGARWLAEARACCSRRLGAVHGQNSIGLQSREAGEVSQSSTQHLGLLTMHTVEDKNPSKSVEGSSGKSVSTCPQNEARVAFSQGSISAGVEQLNQPKEIGSCEIVCGLPASKECGRFAIQPVEYNNEVPPKVPEGVPNDIDYANPVELSEDSSSTGFKKGVGTCFPGASLNQKERTYETTAACLPLVGQRLEPETTPNEIQPFELNKKIPPRVPENVPNGSFDCANPVELSNSSSDERIDDGDAISLPDTFVNQQDETDEITDGGLPLVEQILEPSDHQVPEDQINHGSTCAVICDQDAEVEKQHISLFEVHTSEDGDNVTSEESVVKLQEKAMVLEDQVTSHFEVENLNLLKAVNPVNVRSAQVVENQHTSFEVQDQEVPDTSWVEVSALDVIEIATPEESHGELQHRDAPVVEQVALQVGVENLELVDTVNPVKSNDVLPLENCEELHIGSSDASPSCNHPMSIEVGSHRKSTQCAQIEETEVVLQQSASQSLGNQEIQRNHLDIRSESQVADETNVEILGSYSNNVAMSQTEASTVEFSHQAGLQPGSLAHLYGSSYCFSDPNQWKFPHVFDAPLHDELERIRKETEQLQKNHEDMIVQLRSEREKEIQEINAEINRKYELKLRDAEAKFSLKKNGLDKNRTKVIQSKLLSEVVASTCLGVWSFGLPEVCQVTPHGSMLQHQPLPLQQLVTPDPRPSADQPAPSPVTASPNWQSMQHLSLPHSIPISSQNFRPSQQTMQPLPFSSTSRPPIISAITPIGGDPHFSGGIHSVPPHLQPALTGGDPRFAGENRCVPPQLHPVGPHPTSSLPAASFSHVSPHVLSSAFQSRPQLQRGLPAMLSTSRSPLDLLVDVGDWVHLPSNHTFDSLQQFHCAGQRLSDVQGNRNAFSGVPTDSICLLDEE